MDLPLVQEAANVELPPKRKKHQQSKLQDNDATSATCDHLEGDDLIALMSGEWPKEEAGAKDG